MDLLKDPKEFLNAKGPFMAHASIEIPLQDSAIASGKNKIAVVGIQRERNGKLSFLSFKVDFETRSRDKRPRLLFG